LEDLEFEWRLTAVILGGDLERFDGLKIDGSSLELERRFSSQITFKRLNFLRIFNELPINSIKFHPENSHLKLSTNSPSSHYLLSMLLIHGKQEEKKGAIARNRKFHNEKYTQNNNTKTMLCDHSESARKQVFGYAEMRILIAENVSNVDFVFLTFLRCLPNCDEL
jgi:hypothetical protein